MTLRHLDDCAVDVLASGPDVLTSDLASDELPDGWTLADIRAHLTTCDACCAELSASRTFFAELVVPEPTAQIASKELVRELRDRLSDAPSAKVVPLRRYLVPALAAAASIALVLLLLPSPNQPADPQALASELGIDLDLLWGDPLDELNDEFNQAQAETEVYSQFLGMDLYAPDDEEEDDCLLGCSLFADLDRLTNEEMAALLLDLEQGS